VTEVTHGESNLLQYAPELEQRHGRERHQRNECDSGDEACDLPYGHRISFVVDGAEARYAA
jgi:hypothetical protein